MENKAKNGWLAIKQTGTFGGRGGTVYVDSRC
jgi:hypothetical protein